MSNPTATFAVQLKDETSGPASAAANALARLKVKIDADTKSLREMQQAMSRLKGQTGVSAKTIEDLKAKITAQKASIAASQASFLELGGTFGQVAAKAGGLASILGAGAIAAGITSIATAMIALTTAAIGATAALLGYGIAQANARRSEMLRFAGMRTMFGRLGTERGQALQDVIERVSGSTAAGREDVARYAQGLSRMGLSAEQMEMRLRRITIRRLGGAEVAEAKLNSLETITEKLHENIGIIFQGLRLEGFLTALRSVTSLFSQNTASGRALKLVFETIFQPLLDIVTRTGPIVRRFFQGLIIGAQEIAIKFHELRTVFYRTFRRGLGPDIDYANAALNTGQAVMGVLAIVALALGAALAVVGAVVLGLAAPFIALFAMLDHIVDQFFELKSTLAAVFTDTDWSSIGMSMVQGLIDGIYGMFPNVTEAIENLSAQATGAIQSALGIHSPSRVFMDFGRQIPAGLAAGIDEGASMATGATSDMAPVPGGALGGGSTTTISVSIETIQVTSPTNDARGFALSFREELAKVLEGTGLQIGVLT